MGNFALPLVTDSYGARGSADSDRDARFRDRRSFAQRARQVGLESLTCPSTRTLRREIGFRAAGQRGGELPIQLPVSRAKSGAQDRTPCASATL